MSDLTPSRYPQVLLVDGDARVQRCVALALRQAAQITHTGDVAEAWALLHERSFDVVVAGLDLPESERRDLLVEASRCFPKAMLFLLSWCDPLPGPVLAAARGGLATVLSKPEGLAQLVERVRAWGPELA